MSLWCALVDVGLLYFAFISVCFNICPLFLDPYTLLGEAKTEFAGLI